MAAVLQLQRQFIEYTTSLYNEGYLDDQFTQLQKLQDESNPDFVVDVVSLFFEDSEKLLNNLATALHQQSVDYKEVDSRVHQFKGSCSSIGAQRVTNVCVHFRNYCEVKSLDGCLRCLQQLKHEYLVVRNKLETLFRLEQQINVSSWWINPYDGVNRFLNFSVYVCMYAWKPSFFGEKHHNYRFSNENLFLFFLF